MLDLDEPFEVIRMFIVHTPTNKGGICGIGHGDVQALGDF